MAQKSRQHGENPREAKKMNQYNPSIEVSAKDRFRQRSNEATNARLAASVHKDQSSANDLFGRVKHFVENHKPRAVAGQRKLRTL
jgi:hypothetical protein